MHRVWSFAPVDGGLWPEVHRAAPGLPPAAPPPLASHPQGLTPLLAGAAALLISLGLAALLLSDGDSAINDALRFWIANPMANVGICSAVNQAI